MHHAWYGIRFAPLSSNLFVAALLVTTSSFIIAVATSLVRPTASLILLTAILIALLVIGRTLNVLRVQLGALVRHVTFRDALR